MSLVSMLLYYYICGYGNGLANVCVLRIIAIKRVNIIKFCEELVNILLVKLSIYTD